MKYKEIVMLAAALRMAASFSAEDVKRTAHWPVPLEQERATILWTKPICVQPACYCAWPTATIRPDGEVIVAFSGDRMSHNCPFGKVMAIRSRDNGETWSAPETWVNSVIDDRDAGLITLDNGDLLLHWFSGITFWYINAKTAPKSMNYRIWEKLDKTAVRAALGHWTARSADGGKTWEDPVRIHGQAPHGPIQLKSGRLLMVGRVSVWPGEYMPGEDKDAKHELPVLVSDDRGRSWTKLTSIVPPKDRYPDITAFHEPHVAELPDGTLVAQFRWHGKDEIIPQCESADGGKTWTALHPTGISGLPPHLTVLPDGRLLTVYAVRSPRLGKEIGEYGCLSNDGGRTWDVEHEIKFASHFSHDMGYPSSCVLPDGTILTVYYQTRGANRDIGGEYASPLTCIWATKWKVKRNSAALKRH